MEKIHKLSFVLVLSLFIFILGSTNQIFAISDTVISNRVIELINQKRERSGYKKIITDENLCMLAKLLAEDSELVYPQKINDSLYSNNKYKPYSKNYSNTITRMLTWNDMLIKFYRYSGKEIPLFSAEDIFKESTSGSNNDISNIAINPALTHGCAAVSSGKAGYKPFAYFVGGVKNDNILDKIKLFFSTLFGNK